MVLRSPKFSGERMQFLLEYPRLTYALSVIGALVVIAACVFIGTFAVRKIYRSLGNSRKPQNSPTVGTSPETGEDESEANEVADTDTFGFDDADEDDDLEIPKFANCARSKNANFQPRRKKWPRRK